MKNENITKLKSKKLFLLIVAFLIAKKEIDNYNDKLNAIPSFNIKQQNEKQILPVDGFKLKQGNYLSIKRYECEKSVEKYCKIYGLKKDVIMNIISEYSESFTSPEFQNNKDIFSSGTIYDNFDSQVLLLVHDIYYYPSKYGYSYEEVKCDNNQNICNMTIREYLYETANALGLDKDTALAIACAESYYFEASIATSSNNPFALNSSSGFREFDNIYLGISEGLINLKRGYPSLNISSMASTYCPPNPEDWISLVNGVKYQLENGRMLYDELDKELVLK